MNNKVQTAIGKIQALQQAFADNLPERINELKQPLLNLDAQLAPSAAKNATLLKLSYELAHKLAGSAGTFQFTEVYTAAINLEHFCNDLLNTSTNTAFPSNWYNQLQELQSKIQQGSSDKTQFLSDHPTLSIPESSESYLPSYTNKIILVDDDELLAALTQEQAKHFGIHIECINNPEELSLFLESHSPEIILMDIVFPNYDLTGIELVKQLKANNKIHCPVIFLSNRNDFSARLEAVKAGGNGYIAKPVNILELAEILDKHACKNIKAAPKALIIDDDTTNSAFYTEILQSIHFECHVISDPFLTLEELASFQPDIILLDIHMPACSGYEVAKLIRQDTRFTLTPILFLSADNSAECEIKSLKAGGSCFIHKNADKNTFITQVLTQSQRSRELHSVINRLRKDELRFQAISHSTSDAIITLNKDGLIILWNEGAENIFGYQSIEVIGQSIELIIPEKYRDQHRKGFYNLVSQKIKHHHNAIESQALCKDGTLISIELSYSEWLSGNERFFTSIIRDTTKRKTIEYELKNQQENLKAIVTSSAEGIITISAKGIIEMANPKAYQLFAYNNNELEGNNISILMPKAMRNMHDQYLKDSDTHAPKIINKARDLFGLRKDGSRFPMELNISPMSINGEKKFVGILHDITDRKNALEAITNAKLAAEEANKAKSSFLSSMSHELRTPLNAVLGFSQLLQADDNAPLNPDQEESVQHIYSSGQHLLSLIDEVLDLAKIESKQVNIDLTTVNLIYLLEQSISSITPQLTKANISLNQQLPKQQDIFVHADTQRLSQVMANLLSNAIKYNRPEGSISVYLSQENNKVRMLVKDTGLGIPENMMPDLFAPFNRLGAEQSDIEGTGIGLTITKMLVEMMGGEIGVNNTPGEGCTFWVELTKTSTPEKTATTTPAPQEASSSQLSNANILYIEDNHVNRLLIKKIISSKTDLQYHEASTGEKGIQIALSLKPDIILLDINLPDMDGYQVYQQLQQHDALQHTKVIIISANAMPNDIAKSQTGEFFDYLTKPIEQTELLSLLQNALLKP